MATVEDYKEMLRKAALQRRDALSPKVREAAAETVASRGLPIEVRPGMIVSGYSPLHSEFNPVPLLRRVAAQGAQLALPVVDRRGRPLIMRAYSFGQQLNKGVWGIREPLPDAPEVYPDVLIVPLAAFDRKGNRIGYGAGYYDMTINRLRLLNKGVVAIGVAFAAQESPLIQTTPRDAALDFVLTEREVINCRRI